MEEDKLFFLLRLVPEYPALSSKERKTYIITAMLVQIALDTHELVRENSPEEAAGEKLVNQLHVLAGDYYSGLYYYLLSEIEDLPFIHELASAIKAINESKMQIYYEEYESFKSYMDLKIHVDSLLLETVARYFNRGSYLDAIRQSTYIRLLLEEKEHILQDEILLNSLTDDKPSSPYLTKEDKFRLLLENELFILEDTLKGLPSQGELSTFLSRNRTNEIYMNTSNVEEG